MSISKYHECLVESLRPGLMKIGVSETETKKILESIIRETYDAHKRRLDMGTRIDNGHEALGYTSGKMRRYRIRMNPGDRVKIELSPYDLTRGRIVYRER